MTTQMTIRTLALSLVLVSGAAHAGLFSRKPKQAPPPPPEPAPVVVPVEPPPPPPPIPMEFSGIQTAAPLAALFNRVQAASPEVQAVLQWVGASKDNAGLPFLVVDKVNARVYAFNRAAQLEATAPVLLGMGVGDVVLVSPDAPMSAIPPQKRITPAGRYLSRLVIDGHGKEILSIDGHNLISMHIVVKGTPAQRRAERLASVTSDDNRVSFGCINVPPGFFTSFVSPDFRAAKGVVYILPEKTTAAQLFGFQPAVTAPVALPAPITATATAVQVGVPQTSPATPPASTVTPPASTVTPPASIVAPQVSPAPPQVSPAPPQVSPVTPQVSPVTPQALPVTVGGAAAEPAPDAR